VAVDENEPTPEPVFQWTMIVPVLMAIETTLIGIWTAFFDWRPTTEQLAALASIQTPLVLIVGFLTALKARNKVTPNEKVALTKADVHLIDAAQGPVLFTSPAKGDHGAYD
jgi:hypothetical protein